MKPSELLRQKGWCQRILARDAQGNKVLTTSPDAIAYCAAGSMMACGHGVGTEMFIAVTKELGSIFNWNDAPGRTAEEVIAKLEEFGL